MVVTEKDYKRWSNMSKIICSSKVIAEEVLQELLLNMIEKNITTPDKVNDSYIFMSLKNRFLNYIKKEKNRKIDYVDNDDTNLTELLQDTTQPEDLQELIIKNLEDQEKINVITETILQLESYDKKLYQLHFIWGLSQREIAKKIGISHMTINMRINKIKDKIKRTHEQGR
jgi:RNA polymerase sigma factor (sigma-70 family)